MAKYTYTDENGNKTIIKLTDCRVSNEENRVYEIISNIKGLMANSAK